LRAESSGYFTKSADEIFTQQAVRRIHEQMDPKGVLLRECRDSQAHPNTFPVVLTLDVTGSMGMIPQQLIQDGLPTLMSKLIQRGLPDVSLCFAAVGDHECDRYPLQVGQFESGDAELDMWLTRTYLEKGGGGNSGESYLLAYYFAAYHTETDSFVKRGKKGLLVTIGDEPCLKSLPHSAVSHLMGESAVGQTTYSVEQLLAAAQQKFHVYHINVIHGGRDASADWQQRLGDHLINVTDYRTIPDVIAEIALQVAQADAVPQQPTANTAPGETPSTDASKPQLLW
jgi:hypothetical protein